MEGFSSSESSEREQSRGQSPQTSCSSPLGSQVTSPCDLEPPDASGPEGPEAKTESTEEVKGLHTPGLDKQKRFQAKMILLTWSQSPDLTKEMIMNHLKSLVTTTNPLVRAIVAREHHLTEEIHFHAVMEVTKSQPWNPLRFKILTRTAHCLTHRRGSDSYQRSLRRVWMYCAKEDKEPLIFGEEPPEKRTRADDFRTAMKKARVESVGAALEYLMETQPYEMVVRRPQIQWGLAAARADATRVVLPARALDTFKNCPKIDEDWRVLYLWGDTGLGKTQYARALLPNALIIRHTDALKQADLSEGVIFDDFDVNHWPITPVIHLLDWDEESQINVKHGHVVIPPHTRKIFTMNLPPEQWVPDKAAPAQRQACFRRMKEINIKQKLYSYFTNSRS